eukprot:11127334-Lingulodinium_polyedra.AAC.1
MQGRTELAEMLPSSQMRVVEDANATALPRNTDLDGAVKGAPKYAQLGQDALEKILDAATTDLIMAGR